MSSYRSDQSVKSEWKHPERVLDWVIETEEYSNARLTMLFSESDVNPKEYPPQWAEHIHSYHDRYIYNYIVHKDVVGRLLYAISKEIFAITNQLIEVDKGSGRGIVKLYKFYRDKAESFLRVCDIVDPMRHNELQFKAEVPKHVLVTRQFYGCFLFNKVRVQAKLKAVEELLVSALTLKNQRGGEAEVDDLHGSLIEAPPRKEVKSAIEDLRSLYRKCIGMMTNGVHAELNRQYEQLPKSEPVMSRSLHHRNLIQNGHKNKKQSSSLFGNIFGALYPEPENVHMHDDNIKKNEEKMRKVEEQEKKKKEDDSDRV